MNEAPQQKRNSAAEDQSASPTDTQTIQHPLLATIQQWIIYLFFGALGLTIVTTPLAIILRMMDSQHIDLWFTVWRWAVFTLFSSGGVLFLITWINDYFYRKERNYGDLFWAIAMFLIAFAMM